MKTEINLNGLCKCEYEKCEKFFNGAFAAPENMDENSTCPFCGKMLTLKSFGLKIVRRKKEREAWIGPDGNWTRNRPQKDFLLGEYWVRVGPKRTFLQQLLQQLKDIFKCPIKAVD
ncbi:hypothetical protein ACFLYY_01645 [Patescibacteria group bacterium]